MVKWILTIVILLIPVQATATNLDTIIDSVRAKEKLPVGLLRAVIKVESAGNRGALNKDDGTKAQKRRGRKVISYGLMQIQMAAARHVGFRGTPKQLLEPATNIKYGAKYLKNIMNNHGGRIAQSLVCYNSGPNSLACRSPKITEYIDKILVAWGK